MVQVLRTVYVELALGHSGSLLWLWRGVPLAVLGKFHGMTTPAGRQLRIVASLGRIFDDVLDESHGHYARDVGQIRAGLYSLGLEPSYHPPISPCMPQTRHWSTSWRFASSAPSGFAPPGMAWIVCGSVLLSRPFSSGSIR